MEKLFQECLCRGILKRTSTNCLINFSLDSRHSGDFTCVASNPAAEVRFTAKLQVKGTVLHVPHSAKNPQTPKKPKRLYGVCRTKYELFGFHVLSRLAFLAPHNCKINAPGAKMNKLHFSCDFTKSRHSHALAQPLVSSSGPQSLPLMRVRPQVPFLHRVYYVFLFSYLASSRCFQNRSIDLFQTTSSHSCCMLGWGMPVVCLLSLL